MLNTVEAVKKLIEEVEAMKAFKKELEREYWAAYSKRCVQNARRKAILKGENP